MDGWLKNIKRLLVSFIIVGFAQSVMAAELHEMYNGVRGLGMGGASIAVVNDETALVLNPAALGKLRDYFVTVVDPELSMSGINERIYSTDILAPLTPQTTMATLAANEGVHTHASGKIFPSLVLPNFGIGFLGSFRADAEVLTGGTEFLYEYRNDYAFVMGFNFRLFDGKVKFGFNGKIINRVDVNESAIDTTTTGNTISSLSSEGMGIGADVGLLMTGPWKMLPTLSIVARDVGNTRFDLRDGLFNTTTLKPANEPQKVDVAMAIFPIVGRTSVTLEVRDVTTLSAELDKNRRYHFGFEFNFYDALFLRGGYNQRYWTAGFELAVNNYQLQLATYGEEIGTATTPREDRRYMAKFAYRL